MTPSGIETATFWLVVLCPNQLRQRNEGNEDVAIFVRL
jgi:hypothetical protein